MVYLGMIQEERVWSREGYEAKKGLESTEDIIPSQILWATGVQEKMLSLPQSYHHLAARKLGHVPSNSPSITGLWLLPDGTALPPALHPALQVC